MDKLATLSTVTRSLMLSVGLGAPVALTACSTNQTPQPAMMAPEAGGEQQALQEAMASRSPRDATQFLRSYPRSRSIPSLLASLPPSSLHAIPRGAIAGLPRQTLCRIDPALLGELRIRPACSPVAEAAPPRISGGGGGGGGRY
ncbi:hypothetical protein [Labrys wisconsinensis]|uniref:Uncharacterized protein n=1 Tax=Labrys wisconsinensis TaxID=425677 RepID=A0ABU0J057_9HYPH|nr:hypothetical protein [Labrys wisconsinensis]MDQ0467646.1 hypothetical protein [Labrys wisconsinensis]